MRLRQRGAGSSGRGGSGTEGGFACQQRRGCRWLAREAAGAEVEEARDQQGLVGLNYIKFIRMRYSIIFTPSVNDVNNCYPI